MKNLEIAEIFSKMADILELKGENIFKVNAYRKASRVLKELQDDVEDLWKENRLHELPGLGKALAGKIEEYITTGKIKRYEELKKDIPDGLLELLNIQNLGPKTLTLAHKQLHVNNLQDLLRVIKDGSLAQLPGMGEKKVENIKKSIEFLLSAQGRISIGIALPVAEEIIDLLTQQVKIEKISVAGSLRRMKETIGDIDILAVCDAGKEVIDAFVTLPVVADIIAHGATKASIRVQHPGIQVDLRVVPPESYGAALLYFTGSKAHNIKLRSLAKKKSLKINEYGLFSGDKRICGITEQEIYDALELCWIPPELREDRGEVELALQKKLPNLIELKDIKGDLHIHSNYSDGHNTLVEIADKAKGLGYQYIAICDHSQSAHYANGLSLDRLKQEMQEIDDLNKKWDNFKILKGAEVDILSNGELDLPDEVLQQLDIVVASIHSGFKQDPTARIIKAMANPFVDIIAHPTGRLINQREGYDVDMGEIIKKAKETGTALELNSHPDRLDLCDTNAKSAAEMGVFIAIDTDAHAVDNLSYMKFGIGTARRGWLTKKNVLNCLNYSQLLDWKKQRG